MQLSGWVAPVAEYDVTRLVLDFADAHPCDSLFDVGLSATLLRLDLAEVHLEEAGGTTEVDPEDFLAARPDAVSRAENDLMADQCEALTRLAGRVQRWVGRHDHVRLLGLDRFGVRYRVQGRSGCYDLRVPFAAPLDGPAGFADRGRACSPAARLRRDRARPPAWPCSGDGHGRRARASAAVRDSSARAASAFSKHSCGGWTSPAPTWPVPATRPAMPVLICGSQPVRATLRTSIPVGEPRKPMIGIAIAGFSASVSWYIRSVVASASGTVPPTKRTIAGAAAIEKPADAVGLHDRGVADVGVRVVGAVVAEEEADRGLRGAGEPAVAGAGGLDAELGAVARHDGHQRRAGDVAGGVHRELRRRHAEVEVEVLVAADELQDRGDVGRRRIDRDDRRRQLAQGHQRPGPVAVVALVAHLQHLGEDRLRVERIGHRPHRVAQDRPEDVAHPAPAG